MKKIYASLVHILILVIASSFNSCKKEDISNTSTLFYLQNKWTPISFRIYFPDGSNYKLIPPISQSFTLDGNLLVENYVTTNSGTIIQEEIIAAYKLLPDDSTLLFYSVINGVQNKNADTSFISKISDELLVYYSLKDNIINSVDSLKR